MKSTKPLIVANWKTALTYHAALNWLIRHTDDLIFWNSQIKLVLCPEHTILAQARFLLPQEIGLGAQSCSYEQPGRATGSVSALSLADLNIEYCIVNHSETSPSLTNLSGQLEQLRTQNIVPIICISDVQALEAIIKNGIPIAPQDLIALEPPHAVGKDAATIEWIKHETKKVIQVLDQTNQKNMLLYGGGVTHTITQSILEETPIRGFLIGRASSDFQALEKIVSSLLDETNTREKCI